MIPKIIHFCWLSDEPYPELIRFCMESWKKEMPGYEIRKWDMSSFDINSVRFVKEACEQKKWAFAADYIRLYAIYNHGGIYLDSDVFVKKSFDSFLDNEFFSSVECTSKLYETSLQTGLIDKDGNIANEDIKPRIGIAIQGAIIGGVKGCGYIKDCLEYYNNQPFVFDNGELNNKNILPDVMAFVARKYGFRYYDKEQLLDGKLKLYPSVYFAGYPDLETKESYAIHCCTGSWRNESLVRKFINYIKNYLFRIKR